MKQNRIINSLLVCLAVFFAACSEEVYSPSFSESKNVTLSLSYADLSPREITVNTRATLDDAAERKLDNLYIYIFNENGELKGFKAITENLVQNTTTGTNPSGTSVTGDVSGIKTKSGVSYIYAVANVKSDGLYPIQTSSDAKEDGKLPVFTDENKVQDGDYANTFTKSDLMALLFNRSTDDIDFNSTFLMSGSLNGGEVVNIGDETNPTITDASGTTQNIIKLRRVVAKVKFTLKAKTGDGVTRSFTLSSYDIMNVAKQGSLISNKDANTDYTCNSFGDKKGLTLGVNDVDAQGRVFFEYYLPENLQTAQKQINSTGWSHLREDDNQNTSGHVFTNAPQCGTYVVLKGKYSEEKSDGTIRNADVTYYVHLGDCSDNVNDYNVERNCEYTYNITVAGVDKIIVEAEKKGNEQPGSEGVVLEFGAAGKSMTLDSHYDYMVMRFYQNDIQTLKNNNKGYTYQVKTINGKTDLIMVTDKVEGNTNSVDTDWIEFAFGNSYTSTYNASAGERGTACKYPGHTNNSLNSGLYSIDDFLKKLYENASTDNFWSSGSDASKGKYLDVTCFVKENYYADKTWDKYVNTDNRTFYVANEAAESTDGRSVYAKVQYGIDQYAIQTFYDRKQASSIVAYGVETIDETKVATYDSNTQGNETWHGRTNFLADLKQGRGQQSYGNWTRIENLIQTREQCLKRNRDLNGDGKIDANEIRWYAPTIDQYTGLWIGSGVISSQSMLYNKNTSSLGTASIPKNSERMLYWAASPNHKVFFSEEGMAIGNDGGSATYAAKNIRCVRNLKSSEEGYDQTPDKYYTTSNNTIDLSRVDEDALNNTPDNNEFVTTPQENVLNKPAKKFTIANSFYPSNKSVNLRDVVNGTSNCKGYSQDSKAWRVPNQREFCMMYIALGSKAVEKTVSSYWGNTTYESFCRAIFSNSEFRYSWTYSGGNVWMLMPNEADTRTGYIRCIHAE